MSRSFAFSIALIASASVDAQSSSAELWRVEGCAQVPSAEVARLLALELTTQRSTAAASSEGVSLRCRGLEASVQVARGATDAAPLELVLDLAESKPEARARVLALAIAELIATARLEQSDVAPAADAAATREPVRLGLSLHAGAARALEPAVVAPAFALGALQRWAAFSVQLDVALELARLQRELAVVNARQLSLSLAPGWQVTWRRFELGLALGLRVGHSQLTATAREAGQHGVTLSGWVLMPIARATLELVVLRALGLQLGVEAGYVVKPLRGLDADGQSLAATRGLRVAALLGVVVWLDGV